VYFEVVLCVLAKEVLVFFFFFFFLNFIVVG
jgi:hypothetical protein